MLSESYYERIFSVIGKDNLKSLSPSQEASLMKGFEKLLKQKNGDLGEVTADAIIEVWVRRH
jgi:ABC-type transporter MlaC component